MRSFLLCVVFFLSGKMGFTQHSVDGERSKTRKMTKTYSLWVLQTRPKIKIPEYFHLADWGPTGEYVVRSATNKTHSSKSKSYYVYYPVYGVSPGGALWNESSAKFFLRKTTRSIQKDNIQKMINDVGINTLVVEHRHDHLETGIVNEFKKMNVKISSSPVVLFVKQEPCK